MEIRKVGGTSITRRLGIEIDIAVPLKYTESMFRFEYKDLVVFLSRESKYNAPPTSMLYQVDSGTYKTLTTVVIDGKEKKVIYLLPKQRIHEFPYKDYLSFNLT